MGISINHVLIFQEFVGNYMLKKWCLFLHSK